jgi:hypothetical protein
VRLDDGGGSVELGGVFSERCGVGRHCSVVYRTQVG